jgi:hypothetical protein
VTQLKLQPEAFVDIPHEYNGNHYTTFEAEFLKVDAAHVPKDFFAEQMMVDQPIRDVSEFLNRLTDAYCGDVRRHFKTEMVTVHKYYGVLKVKCIDTESCAGRDDVWSLWTLPADTPAYAWFQSRNNTITSGVLAQDPSLFRMMTEYTEGEVDEDRKEPDGGMMDLDLSLPPSPLPPSSSSASSSSASSDDTDTEGSGDDDEGDDVEDGKAEQRPVLKVAYNSSQGESLCRSVVAFYHPVYYP